MIFGKKRGPAKELLGKTFGRLTVTEWAYRENRHNHWICICECGGKTVATSGNLVNLRVRSCGCLLTEFNKNHPRRKTPKYSNLLSQYF